MRTLLVILASSLLVTAFFACKKAEAPPTAETAGTAAAAMSVDDIKGQLKTVLEEADSARAGAEKPSPELVQGFKDDVAKLETLRDEVKALDVPEAEKETYAEALVKVEAGIEGITGLATLSEAALSKEATMTEDEMKAANDTAKAKFLEACEYAAPDIAIKLSMPKAGEMARP